MYTYNIDNDSAKNFYFNLYFELLRILNYTYYYKKIITLDKFYNGLNCLKLKYLLLKYIMQDKK